MIDYRRITVDRVRKYSICLFDSSRMDYVGNYLDEEWKDLESDFLINNVLCNYQLSSQYWKQQNTKLHTKDNYGDATLVEYGFNFCGHIAFGIDDIDIDIERDGKFNHYVWIKSVRMEI